MNEVNAEATPRRAETQKWRPELTPGTPLRLEDLARQLGMSISPIREAVRQLEALGLAIVGADGYEADDVIGTLASEAEMPVDILSHPTLLPLPIRELPVDELWTDALEERLVNALFRAEIAFEISNRYRPHERLVKRAHDRGVRLSLGSDGHTRAQVGDLAFPLEMAMRVGAETHTLFDPYVHGTRAAR